jgi:prolyl-tRNA synthetase
LQCGTSHYLGQSFAKAFNIKFLDADGVEKLVHTTSWGVTTRLIGCLIMVHSDDDGLVLPPKITPIHVVIMPMEKNGQEQDNLNIFNYAKEVKQRLSQVNFNNKPIIVEIDASDKRMGEKAWSHVKKGIPLRIEIGKRELEDKSLVVSQRIHEYGNKQVYPTAELVANIASILETMQAHLFTKASNFMQANTITVNTKEEFYLAFANNAGFVIAPWIDEPISEGLLKTELKVTARCIPENLLGQTGTCIFTGTPNCPYTVFARSY